MAKRDWFEVFVIDDKSDGWSPDNEVIVRKALQDGYSYALLQAQGCRSYAVKCTAVEIDVFVEELGKTKYGCYKMDVEDLKNYNIVHRLSGKYLVEKISARKK